MTDNKNKSKEKRLAWQYWQELREVKTDDPDKSTYGIITSLFIVYGKHLSSNAFRVYSVLRVFRNDKIKRCDPSMTRLAALTGMQRNDVNFALKELVEFNWISRRKSPFPQQGGGMRSMQNDFIYPTITDDFGTERYITMPTKQQAEDWQNQLKFLKNHSRDKQKRSEQSAEFFKNKGKINAPVGKQLKILVKTPETTTL